MRDKWDDSTRGTVRGYTWKMRMSNGAVFEAWTGQSVTRAEARTELMRIANLWCDEDDPAYDHTDIENLWKTKG